MTHRIKADARRTLEFEGDLLAHSTSWEDHSERWVEFFLYRTKTGNWVVNRIGYSLLYHRPECAIAERNKLKIADAAGLERGAVPCKICLPGTSGTVCVEEPRYWAQQCKNANAVVESCRKYDDNGTPYLTKVVRRLLEQASAEDESLRDAYFVEHVL